MKRFLFALLALALVAGCQPIQRPPESAAPIAVDAEWQRALAGEFEGTTVQMAGNWPEEMFPWPFGPFETKFEEVTGIDLQYSYADELDTTLHAAIRAGEGPDVMEFMAQNLVTEVAKEGHVVDVAQFIPMETLQERYKPEWVKWATFDGPDGPIVGGLYTSQYLRGVIWYPKAAFEAAGYRIPQTWDELMALSDQIVADGGTPWCIENGSMGGGWEGEKAAIWLTQLMLDLLGEDGYERWVRGEIKFDSPEFRHALDLMDSLWFAPGYSLVERAKLDEVYTGDFNQALMADPPQCWLMPEPSWSLSLNDWFASEHPLVGEFGKDISFFPVPGASEGNRSPVLVEGHMIAMFHDRPEVRALMQYISHGKYLESWTTQTAGTWWDNSLSMQPVLDPALFTSPLEVRGQEINDAATSLGFDFVSRAPLPVVVAFVQGMRDYVEGTIDADTLVERLDAAWEEAPE